MANTDEAKKDVEAEIKTDDVKKDVEAEIKTDDVKKDDAKASKKDDAKAPKKDDAKAPKKDDAKASKNDAPKAPKKGNGLPTPAWIGIAAACLIVGVLVGRFVLGAGMSATGKTTLTQDELGSTVATYTYNGKTENVTAQQAIEATTTLDSAKNDDETYNMPSADSILSCARNQILTSIVEEEGITVSDDDVKAYAKEQLGTDDYDTIASQYGMTTDAVEKQLKQSAAVKQLYDKIVGSTDLTAPTAPEKDKDAATYGKYITDLAGDEWDSSKNTWASTDGAYYSALGADFAVDQATYEQATTAYYVAYQQYSSEYSQLTSKWTSYVNGKLANASLQLSTLVS